MQKNKEMLLQFYRLPQLKERIGVSSATIWNWCKRGTFPRPVKLSANTTAWPAADVDSWAADRIAESRVAK